MMIQRHYDEEALVTMLDAGGASDQHLEKCGECTEKLESFRLVTVALRDGATWDKRQLDERPNPNTIATLRAFATSQAAQDAVADAYLADLLAGSRETWMAKLASHPEYRTPGTVRRLIAATDRALDTMPADAVEITALATDIAEHLDPDTHRPDTVARLRGAAWRERAYALFYTGQIAGAEKAVAMAEAHFAACVVDEYELARVGIVRALVERAMERYDEGLAASQSSANGFAQFEDMGRMVSARIAQAQLQFSTANFPAAYDTLTQLEKQMRGSGELQTRAIVLANLGYCASKLRRNAEAIQFHQNAAAIFTEIGMDSDAIRSRWSIASILAGDGKIEDALPRLRAVHEEFAARGMAGAAADVALQIAELLVAGQSYAEAEQVCRAVMEYVKTAGLTHAAPALTALGIMHEAVSNRTATTVVVKHVREYLRRLPTEPMLLFALPPEG